MRPIRSDRLRVRGFAAVLGLALLAGGAVLPRPASAQQATLAEVASSEFSISRETAALRLELASGRVVELALRGGAAYVDGQRVGDAPRGSPLDRSWRELLNQGMDASSAELPQLLTEWSGPGATGTRMAEAVRGALRVAEAPASADVVPADAVVAPAVPGSDSVSRLVERIAELEAAVQRAERRATRVTVETGRRSSPRSPLRHVADGLAGVFSLLITYAVLFAIAFGVIVFGGRKYIEGVGDTARHATTRSFLVGLAASFLVIPAFILGMIALVISIVGIPGLLVWVPGFPVAVVLGVLLGYLGVAHATGEAVAERRFYVTDWFQRGNSYYFLLSGLGVLLAFFLAGQVVHMAGPWLRVISGLLMFLGFVSTGVAIMVGFGAVLISRGGTKPVRAGGIVEEQDLFTEEAGV